MNAPENPSRFRIVGTRPVRPDGIDKVTGKAIYSPDFAAPGMIHGAILRSPHAHARIRGINTRKAEALPGVKAVITGRDFPTVESLEVSLGEGSGNILHTSRNCMALEKALYHGHAVAAVAATSEAIARAALALIEVDYEVLPHVITVAEAQAPGAPIIHDTVFTSGLDETPITPSNTSSRFVIADGDPDAALAASAVVVEASFSTQPVHQCYIEPHGCVASFNADGQAQIWASSQGAFMIRDLTASILGLRQADIRVTPLEIGGGFGGKTTVYLEPVAMLLSRKAGRPVRIMMTRDEVFRASGPAPGTEATVRIGAAADGTLTGAIIEFTSRGGAFPGADVHPSAMHALAHYRVPARRVTGWEVVTNTASTAAYRAPGAPQTVFPVECCMDELATRLGMDPIELRLKNAVRPGDKGLNHLPLGAVGFVECLEAAKAHPHYTAPLGPNQGRGIAGGSWANYGGPSTVELSVADDGSVLVVTGSPDIGGSRASMAMMAAETLGLPYEAVRVTIADTSSIGVSMATAGSRTTFATGRAVVDAAKEVIAALRDRAANIWGAAPSGVEWRDGAAHCLTGDNAGQSLSIAQIAGRAGQFSGQVSSVVSVTSPDYLPGFAVHICDTELDPETGHLRVVRYTAVQDVGRAIHPDYVEGQLQGGSAQGIGWALSEAYSFNSAGEVENAGFLDYRMPVCSDLPMIDTVMVEVPNPGHPYGVKGVGEVPIVPPLAAVAIAASHAAGVPLRHLPLSPDKVYAALQSRN